MTALVGVGLGLACGRSPIFQPCAERLGVSAVLTCDPERICEAPEFSITNRPANALIVLDRSCSMATLIDGRSKWARAVDAVTAVVDEPRANLRWGLSLFPTAGVDACAQGPIAVPVGSEREHWIRILLQEALDRDSVNHPGEPCGTNLAGATQQVLDDEPFGGLDGRHYVVLITDGRHAGCPGSGAAAIDDIAQLYDRGVQTVVVGFGGGENTDVLQRMGEAGGVPASAETAYHHAGLDDLGPVLLRVVHGLSCRHPLAIDADLDRVHVEFDGDREVLRDLGDGEGWSYVGEALVFEGEACDELQRGDVESIEISLSCG